MISCIHTCQHLKTFCIFAQANKMWMVFIISRDHTFESLFYFDKY